MEHDAAASDVRLTRMFIMFLYIWMSWLSLFFFHSQVPSVFVQISELLYTNSFLFSVWAYGTKTLPYGQDQTDLIYELIL